ncbi:MAG: hypothetical protein QY306_13220 [Anaerolineales bacterium]|nr:MAG: hypothetical protein QY306_13220 [Anaerolineales bacterium]
MDTNIVITTVITVFLAFVGYLATYLNNLRLSQRSEKLDRVNRQLSELYGPLFALTHASDIAWRGFRSVNRPGQPYYFGTGNAPTEAELTAWRLWMTTVFMPINLRIYEIILSKSDLLIETQMPECLLMFCAHVTAYQAVLKKWESNDFSEHLSVINYPNEIIEYSKKSYQYIKAEQEKLIDGKVKRAK